MGMWFGPRYEQPSVRRKRVALLSIEADVQREAVAERAKSISDKAGFLLVVVGFLVGFTILAPSAANEFAVQLNTLLFLRAALALVAGLFALIAIWPLQIGVIDPSKLAARWIDTDESDYALEMYLLQSKIDAWRKVSARTASRMIALEYGFLFTSATVVATFFALLLGLR